MIKSGGNGKQMINTHSRLNKYYTKTAKLVFGSIFAAFAAIFQSAGIFVGFGYVISIMATLPILLSTMISLKIGLLSYFTTILLLIMIQPSELIIFSFTTGLLGICLGMAFKWWKNWIAISLFAGIALTLGMIVILYFIQFPILGPTVSNAFDLKVTFFIFLFSLAYSLIWMVLCKKISVLFLKGDK